mmetsp:Transcript_43450/g.100568  ORF Transcript_43450/g.100568 Transcript_43450/m.100568 type:complete len:212 (-) Transcript_43450:1083-1718(-)
MNRGRRSLSSTDEAPDFDCELLRTQILHRQQHFYVRSRRYSHRRRRQFLRRCCCWRRWRRAYAGRGWARFQWRGQRQERRRRRRRRRARKSGKFGEIPSQVWESPIAWKGGGRLSAWRRASCLAAAVRTDLGMASGARTGGGSLGESDSPIRCCCRVRRRTREGVREGVREEVREVREGVQDHRGGWPLRRSSVEVVASVCPMPTSVQHPR